MKQNKFPLITIIISNYNGAKLNILQECLQSFVKIDYPNYELLLVDNNSQDESMHVAKKIFGNNPKFKIIKNPVNMYSQGVNLGFQSAKGEYIALFNNDIELKSGYLQKLLNAFNKYPKLAVAQGKLLWFKDPTIVDSAGESMDVYGNPVTLGYQQKNNGLFDKELEVLSATGAACLIKKEALDLIGGYDNEYGIGYEDMDHCLRFRQRGYMVMYIPAAVVFHKRGVTDLSYMVKVKVRWHFNKNRLSTMIRNYPLSLLLKTIPVAIFIYLGSFIWEVIVYRNIEIALTRIKAIFWVLTNLPSLIKERIKIRRYSTKQNDKKILQLFAKSDIGGKVEAVIRHRLKEIFSVVLKQIHYSIPWTYPSEIKKLIPQNSSVLDVGCGDGNLMEWINYGGNFKVIGIDINKADLKIASKRFAKDGSSVYSELLTGDLTKEVPFKKKFDVVLCSQVVEHLKKEQALLLIDKMEKLANKRVIIATINGFFQFDHRVAGKYDIHLSGWSPKEFKSRGYKVYGSGLRWVYKPGALKDQTPNFLHPVFFIISYLATPILRFFHSPALLLITYKDINAKV